MKNILIASVPRSGSSWLGRIFESAPNIAYRFQPNFSYTFEPTVHSNSDSEAIEHFYSNLILTKDPFVLNQINADQQQQSLSPSSANCDTLVWKEVHGLDIIPNLILNSNTTVVCLIRSPLAVLNSWFNAPREFDPNWDVKTEWEFGEKKNQGRWNYHFGYDAWKKTTLNFMHLQDLHPTRVHLIQYRDLLADPSNCMSSLFNRLQIPWNSSVNRFITLSTSSHDNGPYAVAKIKKKSDDEWQNSLDADIVARIQNDVKGTPLEMFL